MPFTCPFHLIQLDVITLMTFGKEYKLRIFPPCSFFQPPLNPNIFFGTHSVADLVRFTSLIPWLISYVLSYLYCGWSRTFYITYTVVDLVRFKLLIPWFISYVLSYLYRGLPRTFYITYTMVALIRFTSLIMWLISHVLRYLYHCRSRNNVFLFLL
jgi:hypothetical protein